MRDREPVRVYVWAAAVIAATAGVLLDVDAGATVLYAAGQALAQLAVVVGAAEGARRLVDSPATRKRRQRRFDNLVDAEAVLDR